MFVCVDVDELSPDREKGSGCSMIINYTETFKVPIKGPLMSELINTMVFHNLAPVDSHRTWSQYDNLAGKSIHSKEIHKK